MGSFDTFLTAEEPSASAATKATPSTPPRRDLNPLYRKSGRLVPFYRPIIVLTGLALLVGPFGRLPYFRAPAGCAQDS
jgi:hypothetical protein